MNKLVRTILDTDDMSVPYTVRGVRQPIAWTHPYDRERNRVFDWTIAEMLVARGYLEWTMGDDHDPRYLYLTRTPRGQAIVRLYRGAAFRNALDDWRGNYRRWLFRAHLVSVDAL